MAEKNSTPFLVKLHNTTCPAWLLGIGLLKKLEPGCRMASKYEK